MKIERPFYLDRLIRKKDNRRIKIITGLRRCGKSYLLFILYRDYLLREGVPADHIITLALDELANARYRNPVELDAYLRGQMKDDGKYYLFIDEIQFVEPIPNPYLPSSTISFIDVVLGLMKLPNADVYITGSNSKMLSSDILTQFRDRGDEIRVYPLSYPEFLTAYEGPREMAFETYCTYGGMPLVLTLESGEEKGQYLKDLFQKTYLRDILERHHLQRDPLVLDDLLDIISSSIGSLTNPSKLARTFESVEHIRVSAPTLNSYLNYFLDAFLLERARRYDIKGKKYIDSPFKYYFTDVGLRNARLNFRQQEETHIMENVIFSDLVRRGFSVDVGNVEYNYRDAGKTRRKALEVDFVVNRGSQRYYIQSAFSIDAPEKRQQETRSLQLIRDSFQKIVVVRRPILPWHDDTGILYVGVEQFLTDNSLLK